MIKRILLGLLIPCVSHAMEKERVEKEHEDDELVVYSRGNPEKRFELVAYDQKTKVPELIIFLYGSRTLTIGSKSQSVYEELKAAYEQQQK